MRILYFYALIKVLYDEEQDFIDAINPVILMSLSDRKAKSIEQIKNTLEDEP